MQYLRFPFSIALLVVLSSVASAADKVTYEADVQPILREHCFACHNQDDATASLALDSYEGVLAGGAGGEVLAAGDADSSRLWKLVTHEEEPQMPPGDKLPPAQLKILRDWIEGGLLKDAGSKPMKSKKAKIAKIDAADLGKPKGEPATPEQLFHEPVLWTANAGPVDALATSPGAPLLAVGWQRQISFYDTNTFQLLGILPFAEGVPRVVRFSRDGSLLLVAGGRHAASGSAVLFDVKTGARLATVGDELDIVLAADISPDLSLVAIGGPKKRVRVYRVADGSLAYKIEKHTDWVTALAFSPNGKLLATADRNGGALLWQAAQGLERADLRGHKQAITSLDWRADAAMLATASEDGTVRLWNPKGNQIKSVNAHGGGVLSVRFAKNGNWVSAGRDRKVKAWKPDGAALAELGQFPGMALAADFAHDGNKVIASDYTGELRVIDLQSKKPLTTLQANPPTLSQRLSTTGKLLKEQQQLAEQNKQTLASKLAALDQGKAAHAAHEKKLATARDTLASQKSKLAELTQAHATHNQAQQKAQEAASQATAKLEAATAELTAVQSKVASKVASEKQDSVENDSAENTDQPKPAAPTEPPPTDEQIAALTKAVESARAAQAKAAKQLQQQQTTLKTATDQMQAGQKEVQSATAALAQVNSETAGLPDLKSLQQQHDQAAGTLATAQVQVQQTTQQRQAIAEQQARLSAAMTFFANKKQEHQQQLSAVSQQSTELQAKHDAAAKQLAQRKAEREKLAQQLKSLKQQLQELRTAEAASKHSEDQLAAQLEAVLATQSQAEQAIELLDTRERDFSAAQELRKAYQTQQSESDQ